MKKNILFLLVSFMFINSSALTYGGCEYSTVSRMKSIVSNVNISYSYTIVNNKASFSVTLNNITNDIYFYDTITNRDYYYSDTNNGEITINNYTGYSGNYKFYSNNDNCRGISLGSKYYNFPSYNKYYNDPLCKDIPNYSLCQKWNEVNYSQEEFEKMVLEYKKPKQIEQENVVIEYEKTLLDEIMEFYVTYYYIILFGLILFCTTIIIIHNKKNKFDL